MTEIAHVTGTRTAQTGSLPCKDYSLMRKAIIMTQETLDKYLEA